MMASLLVLFREVLEAALIISIVAAVTREVIGRSRWILGGIGAGLAGAVIVALFADRLAAAMQGMGEEIFHATVLFAAVGLLSWHNVWMAKHGRELARKVGEVGVKVKEGEVPMHALSVVVAVAVLREGSEVVLFLHGIAAAGSAATDMMLGSVLGLGAGTALGVLLYFGLVNIPIRYFFSVTSWLILLLAAGLAANGAGKLAQAGVLPELGAQIWDSSWLLRDDSIIGEVLHVLVGYTAMPSGIQLVFYGATIAIVGALMIRVSQRVPEMARKKA